MGARVCLTGPSVRLVHVGVCGACALQKRFGIDLGEAGPNTSFKFVYVTRRRLLDPST